MTANSKNSKETRISNTAKKAVSKRKRAGGKKSLQDKDSCNVSYCIRHKDC